MNEGWIKLHRKSRDNLFIRDLTAWGIFTWLLIIVDRNTGKKRLGRFWASEELGIKPTTFYQALKRLEKKYKVLTLSSDNKSTEISLINWHKYQSNDTSIDNKMTTNRQQNDTLQEVENKELRNEIRYLLKIPLEDTKILSTKYVCTENQVISKGEDLFNYCKSKGKLYKDYSALLRNAIKKDFGERGKVQNAVDIIAQKERELAEEAKNYKPFIVDYKKIGKRMDSDEVPF